MLYVLCGTNEDKTREKMHALVEKLEARRPNAEFFRMDGEGFIAPELEGYIGGQGLFEQKCIVVLDHIFENKESKDFVLELSKSMESSSNVFIVLEGAIDSSTKKKLEKVAKKMEEHSLREGKRGFNMFALTDAVGSRNKKKAWLLYREAVSSLSKVDDIHGILVWQIKNMLLAITTGSAKEAGMKPFPYKKSKDFAKNYSKEELKLLSKKLVRILHEGRRGKDLETELERFVLGL